MNLLNLPNIERIFLQIILNLQNIFIDLQKKISNFYNKNIFSYHKEIIRKSIKGSIWSCWRIKSTGPCRMDLTKFPMDYISCILTFESYNYNNKEVNMKWNQPYAVLLFKDIELPDFTLVNYSNKIIEAVSFWNWYCSFKFVVIFHDFMKSLQNRWNRWNLF